MRRLEFPERPEGAEELSEECAHFLRQALRRCVTMGETAANGLPLIDPTRRLGGGEDGADAFCAHPFWNEVDWENLPRVPTLPWALGNHS